MSNKYRIWSNKYKLFTHDPRWPSNQHTHEEYVITPSGEVWTLVTTDYENYFRVLDGSEYIVQRETGLKDKNDKDIYEGDIVKETASKGPNLPKRFENIILKDDQTQRIQKVYWGEYGNGDYVDAIECWMFGELDSLSDIISRTKENYHEWVREHEVIGNILETPDLIK